MVLTDSPRVYPSWSYVVVDLYMIFFFFFQAEDGIRDGTVTGVQTCALPILARSAGMGHIAAGSLAISCLIMTKGLFTIIPVAAGIGFSLLYAKNYKAIFNWQIGRASCRERV